MTRLARLSKVHVYSKILTEMVSRRPAEDTRDVSILYGPGQPLEGLSRRSPYRQHGIAARADSYTSTRCNNDIDTELAPYSAGTNYPKSVLQLFGRTFREIVRTPVR